MVAVVEIFKVLPLENTTLPIGSPIDLGVWIEAIFVDDTGFRFSKK